MIDSLDKFDKRIKDHITVILGQLQKKPDRFGIGEAGSALPQGQWYPPNAFHTFWTLETFDQLQRCYPTDYEKLSGLKSLDLGRRRKGMVLWGRQQLGAQLGLHSGSPASSMLDSDQLAWSLAIVLRFDENLNVNLEHRDFVKQALKCLFSTQTDGTWRHYKPLFHYKEAGNAYCYVFETFAALLQSALQQGAKAEMIRELLKHHSKSLMNLWRYADSTKIPLSPSGTVFGWCSGHRTNVTEPESWATASVFSYAQALRRLVGIWCREEAFSTLNTPRKPLSPEKAAEAMASRGKTWGLSSTPVSEQLWTTFINPVRMHECNDGLEPDSQPIEANHARSAILFGPPGTSKTSLVRALAAVVGWRYVEIHASHFVAQGLTQVQKTADDIFKKLSELDHAVVLFDEIDELVRERDIEKDAFGRFLTTSMLPKLAELWEARKILYFVATNHINYFDSAIIRSHRFDALILVSPPSYETKIEQLTKLLSRVYGLPKVRFQTQEQEIQKELDKFRDMLTTSTKDSMDQALSAYWRELELHKNYTLAKFTLLRYDELDELAYRLAEIIREQTTVPRKITNELFRRALTRVSDTQWRKNKSYADFLRDTQSERRDYQMLNIWELAGRMAKPPAEVVSANGRQWIAKPVESVKEIDVPGFQLRAKPLGRVQLRSQKAR